MQNNITLDKLKKGEKAIIHSFKSNELPAKFYELGFTPGTSIEIKHIAPLQGPMCVNIIQQDSLIAIRKKEANLILINKI
ncbi:ferrous iron transport protein A [Sphingobacterium olei]|uniref:Ferrous iron transport protein A n=1 Tax=Sphingobacterium olei TaxID=2571155 RepID=A0A4V6WHP8_9SPHI|nr:FeoA family protein [Sphingobacterium olei]TJZ54868.1 ferrous iron transport protein A [Sphingobacterium olei]